MSTLEVRLGKLIKSNSHIDYVCQIYGPGEVEAPPAPADYAFGTFVSIPLDNAANDLIGLIYDTQLFNPDFGNLGPRLSPVPDLAAFSPDYLAEKITRSASQPWVHWGRTAALPTACHRWPHKLTCWSSGWTTRRCADSIVQ